MKIRKVESPADIQTFLELPLSIYKNDPNWIRPLNKDIEAVFDLKKNKFFRHGECERFLLTDNNGTCIGRFAVFINKKTATKDKQPTGGMGFFECINDQKAADTIFDYCKSWLQQRGMEAMDGPVNFGERDSWWGLITEGFTPPPYKMTYNPPYYKQLFENYGFKTYFEQWCFSLDPQKDLQEKFYERHDKIAADPDYTARYMSLSNIEKYAEDFRIVYNKAWAKHGGGKELESKQVQSFFKQMKPVIDPKVIWYVYYKNEPVAIFINLPDINQLFKRFNGKFGLLEKIRFFILLKRRVSRKFIGLVFGIVPEHQGKGVDSFIIVESSRIIKKEKVYFDYEMQWIGDFNPKMISIAQSLGTEKTRTLVTYRYLFDRSKPFERHPYL